MLKQRVLSEVMSTLDRHPRLSRLLLRPIASVPRLSDALKVLPRAFMGASAFEIHDVDVEAGRIGIGGVDEVIFSSKFVELFHRELAAKMGEEEKNRTLYAIGRQGAWWEVDQALAHQRWAPKRLADLIANGATLDALRAEPELARFFELTMKMVLRLIINEGGWGVVDELDFASRPIRSSLVNSQEARWLGPAETPQCHLAAGAMAGYASRIFGETLTAREVECEATGASRCLFEIDR